MNYRKVLGTIFDWFNLLPEGTLKNKIKCLIYNADFTKNKNFTISYRKNHYLIKYKGNQYKFLKDPYVDVYITINGYFSHYDIKRGDVLIDCGAFQGTFSILASELVGNKGKIIAFEPDTENYKTLTDHLKINSIENVVVINKGLWSEKTNLKFNNSHGSGSSFFFSNKTSVISVPVVTLDEELDNLGIDHVDFIKADIEGSEIELVKGAVKILANNNVNLAIASYHELNGEKTYIKLEELLKNYGYTVSTTFSYHLTTYACKE